VHFIFDFFGTLVTYREGVRGNPVTRALDALSTYGVEPTAEVLTERFTECFASLETSASATLREFSMRDATHLLFEELGVTVSEGRLDGFIEAYLRDWTENVQGLANLTNWLDALPGSKSVLSNTHHEPMVVGLIERLNMRDFFQRVTDSFFTRGRLVTDSANRIRASIWRTSTRSAPQPAMWSSWETIRSATTSDRVPWESKRF
jgi:FMN phosphatase YigB (HAD superfamily)